MYANSVLNTFEKSTQIVNNQIPTILLLHWYSLFDQT